MGIIFPKTLRGAIRDSQVNTSIETEVYVVCPSDKCNTLYKADGHNGACTRYSYGKVCGAALGYDRNLAHGKKRWTAYKQFQFIPPSAWLKKLFTSKQFNKLLEEHESSRDHGIMEDVYDGDIWKGFSSKNFFSSKYNLGLMLNVDWFRPFKRSEYKVAAIMLTILNLPREERFKKKWTVIAGI